MTTISKTNCCQHCGGTERLSLYTASGARCGVCRDEDRRADADTFDRPWASATDAELAELLRDYQRQALTAPSETARRLAWDDRCTVQVEIARRGAGQ